MTVLKISGRAFRGGGQGGRYLLGGEIVPVGVMVGVTCRVG
jgi:hypothetical protein